MPNKTRISLRQIINTNVEVDIPKYAKMTIAATQKLKKFMYYISTSVGELPDTGNAQCIHLALLR